MKRVALHVVASAVVLLGCAAVPAGAFPGRNGAIVSAQRVTTFIHGPGGDSAVIERSIRVREASGRQRTLASCSLSFDALTSACTSLTYADPAVSPNGRLVAFGAGTRLGVVGIDGGRVRLLPQHSEFDRTPAFSPDGRRLVFTTVTHAQPSLALCDLTCRKPRPLVRGGDNASWSVGGWIAFVKLGAVYRIRPNGHGLRRLGRGGYASTAWSPDGKRLALVQAATVDHAGKVVRPAGVVVMDADGRRARRLGAGARGLLPAAVRWSPDGRRLLVLDVAHRRLLELDADGRLLGADRWAFPERPPFSDDRVTATTAVDWQPLR